MIRQPRPCPVRLDAAAPPRRGPTLRARGLAGATSRGTTATAGVNLGDHLPLRLLKDELIAEALFGEIERRVRPALEAFAHPGAAPEALLGVVQELLAEFERSKDDVLVYLEALLMATRDPEYLGPGPRADLVDRVSTGRPHRGPAPRGDHSGVGRRPGDGVARARAGERHRAAGRARPRRT